MLEQKLKYADTKKQTSDIREYEISYSIKELNITMTKIVINLPNKKRKRKVTKVPSIKRRESRYTK